MVKGGHSIFFVSPQIGKYSGSIRNRKSANLWGVTVPFRKSQIRKFVMINPQIVNPQISMVSQSPNGISSKENSGVSDPDPHWFASAIIN
jgi:hypothetical protein